MTTPAERIFLAGPNPVEQAVSEGDSRTLLEQAFKARAKLVNGLIVGAIIALAAYVRLSHLDLIPFHSDEATALNWTLASLEARQLPLVAHKASVGLFTPPVLLYLAALPLSISRDPTLVAGVIAGLNLLALFLCYRFTKQYFGTTIATVACLLYAVSFWAAFYSRRIWEVSMTPLFTVLFFSSLFSLVVGRRPKSLVWAFLWLSLLTQCRFAPLAYVPLLLLVLLVFRSEVRWKYLVLGGLVFTVALSPYLYFEVKSGFEDIRETFSSLSLNKAYYDWTAFRYALHLISTEGYNAVFGAPSGKLLAVPKFVTLLREALAHIFLVGLAYLIFGSAFNLVRRQARQAVPYFLLLLWFLVPVLFYTRHTFPLYVHYFIMLYPVQFVVIALVLLRFAGLIPEVVSRLGRTEGAKRWLRTVIAITAALVVLFLLAQVGGQVYAIHAFTSWMGRDATTPVYGIPLKFSLTAVERARELSDSMDASVVHVLADQDMGEVIEYQADDKFATKIIDDNKAFVFPANRGRPAAYLTSSTQARASRFLAQHFSDYMVDEVRYPGGGDAFSLYLLPAEAIDVVREKLDAMKPLAHVLGNGVRLEAYNLDNRVEAGGIVTLTLGWQVERPVEGATPPEYRFFAHLLDSEGRKWGQEDAIGYSPGDWWEGDAVISWHEVTVDEGAERGQYWLYLGMYDLDSLKRVQMVDEHTGQADDQLRLGPIKVRGSGPTPAELASAIQYSREAIFGDSIRLLGYSLDRLPMASGETLRLRLYWEALSNIDEDYTVFVHLLGDGEAIISQRDNQPVQGTYPTFLWEEGEVITDEYLLTIPDDASPGTHVVEVGMYNDKGRLTVKEGEAELSADKVCFEIQIVRY